MSEEPLEPISNENMHDAARTLCLSASLMEKALVSIAEDNPKVFAEMLAKYPGSREGLHSASGVVKEWKDFLELRI